MELDGQSMESNGVLGDLQDVGHAWREWLPDPSKETPSSQEKEARIHHQILYFQETL